MFFFIGRNKIFCFFKNESLLLGRGHISKGGQILQNCEGVALKGGKGEGVWQIYRFRFFLGGGRGGLGKKRWGQYFRVGLIPWGTLWWIFGKWFMKMLKKNIHFTTTISIYTGHRHFEVLWSFTLYILQRFVPSLKNSRFEFILLYMHKTLLTLENEK